MSNKRKAEVLYSQESQSSQLEDGNGSNVRLSCADNAIVYHHVRKLMEKSMAQHRQNYTQTLKKAVSGIRRHPTPILTLRDAMSINGVGEKIGAEIIKALERHSQSDNEDSNLFPPSKRIATGYESDCSTASSIASITRQDSFRSLSQSSIKSNTISVVNSIQSQSKPISASIQTNSLLSRVMQRIQPTSTVEIIDLTLKEVYTHTKAMFSRTLPASHISVGLSQSTQQTVPIQQQHVINLSASQQLIAVSSHQELIEAGQSLIQQGIQRVKTISAVCTTFQPSVTVDDPDLWTVLLVVDIRERDRMLVMNSLMQQSIPCEIASHSMGDYMWLARPNGSSELSQAIVLNTIAERKTFADLNSSIIDGRYLEQKSRLRECPLQNKMYIVEGVTVAASSNGSNNVKSQALRTAMNCIQIETDLQVIRTRGIDHTIQFLIATYRQVLRKFNASKGMLYHNYDSFQKQYSKKKIQSMGQLFGYQLKQIPGCSSIVVEALVVKYQTFANMIRRMRELGVLRAKSEISEIKRTGGMQTRLGPKLADTIWKIFGEYY